MHVQKVQIKVLLESLGFKGTNTEFTEQFL